MLSFFKLKNHDTKKYSRMSFSFEDQKATTQNLYIDNKYILADNAFHEYHKNPMNKQIKEMNQLAKNGDFQK